MLKVLFSQALNIFMPVKKCSNGKYRIGSGDCMYTTKEKAERAQQAYYAQKEARGIIDAVLTEALEEQQVPRSEPLSADEIIALARELNVDPRRNRITQMHIFEFAMAIQHALGYPVKKPQPLSDEPENPDPGLD